MATNPQTGISTLNDCYLRFQESQEFLRSRANSTQEQVQRLSHSICIAGDLYWRSAFKAAMGDQVWPVAEYSTENFQFKPQKTRRHKMETELANLQAIKTYFGLTLDELKQENENLSKTDIQELGALCRIALNPETVEE